MWADPRRLCLASAVALTALLAGCGTSDVERYAGLERGNYDVVVVLVDTLRADRLGVYGHDRPTSPELDALAAEGLVFERCMAQSTWTKPTVASLLTGLLPNEHGVHRYASRLEEDVTTLAELLQDQGYETVGIVSNRMVGRPEHGLAQGFESYVLEPPAAGEVPYPRAEVVVDRALEALASAGDAPLFLYVHLSDPHAPYAPPEPWRTRFDRGYEGDIDGAYGVRGADVSPDDLGPDDWQHWLDLYDAEIAYADDQIGRLLDALDARERADETLVVVLADHGEEFFEHGDWMHNPAMVQEVLHVPLILRLPAALGIPAGQRVDELVMQVDLFPTVRDLLGLPPDEALVGTSLLARALLPDAHAEPFAYAEVQHHGHVRRSVFQDRWKRIRADAPERLDRLFDLEADPGEREDLYPSDPPALPRLEALQAWVGQRGDPREILRLEVENRGDTPRRVEVWLGLEAAPVGLDPDSVELVSPAGEDLADGPIAFVDQDWQGTSLPTVGVPLGLPPGDVDRLSVTLAEGASALRVFVQVDGETLAATALVDGRGQPLGAELPLQLPLESLARGAEAPPQASGDALVVRLWRLDLGTAPNAELNAEDRALLDALGYTGGNG